jgi:hypothetical protein
LGELIYKRTEYIELDAPPRSGGQSGQGKHSLRRWEDMIMCSPV